MDLGVHSRGPTSSTIGQKDHMQAINVIINKLNSVCNRLVINDVTFNCLVQNIGRLLDYPNLLSYLVNKSIIVIQHNRSSYNVMQSNAL